MKKFTRGYKIYLMVGLIFIFALLCGIAMLFRGIVRAFGV